jgi:hypothetical protein
MSFITPLYHRYYILNEQRSQNVRTQLWAQFIGRNETLDLSLYPLIIDKSRHSTALGVSLCVMVYSVHCTFHCSVCVMC